MPFRTSSCGSSCVGTPTAGMRESSVATLRMPAALRPITGPNGLDGLPRRPEDARRLNALFDSAVASVVEFLSQHRYLDIEVAPLFPLDSAQPATGSAGIRIPWSEDVRAGFSYESDIGHVLSRADTEDDNPFEPESIGRTRVGPLPGAPGTPAGTGCCVVKFPDFFRGETYKHRQGGTAKDFLLPREIAALEEYDRQVREKEAKGPTDTEPYSDRPRELDPAAPMDPARRRAYDWAKSILRAHSWKLGPGNTNLGKSWSIQANCQTVGTCPACSVVQTATVVESAGGVDKGDFARSAAHGLEINSITLGQPYADGPIPPRVGCFGNTLSMVDAPGSPDGFGGGGRIDFETTFYSSPGATCQWRYCVINWTLIQRARGSLDVDWRNKYCTDGAGSFDWVGNPTPKLGRSAFDVIASGTFTR
jgi:hypothetical protein